MSFNVSIRSTSVCERMSDITHDSWVNEEQLVVDHLAEVTSKWDGIDDKIWGKLVVMRRGWRVAKAWLRCEEIVLDTSAASFTGSRLGLAGLGLQKSLLHRTGGGCRLAMDGGGNIAVERAGGAGLGPAVQLFSMARFQRAVWREERRARPDWDRLARQAVIPVSLVERAGVDLLHQPLWCFVINIVALDLIRSRQHRTQEMTQAERGTPEYENLEETQLQAIIEKESDLLNKIEKGMFFGHPQSWHTYNPLTQSKLI